MPKMIKNEDGSEQEVFTPEEVEQKQKDLIEANKKALEDKDTELGKLKTDLEAAKGKDKKELEQKIATIESTKKDLEESFGKQIKEVVGKFLSGKKAELMKRASTNDPEVEKKIQHYLDTTLKDMPEANEQELAEKIVAATKLATNNAVPDLLSNTLNGLNNPMGNGSADNALTTGGASQELIDFGAAHFGLTKDDFKKHGGKYGKR